MGIQVWQHVKSGERYVVEVRDGAVASTTAPLIRAEVLDAIRDGFDGDAEMAEALNAEQESYRLVELLREPDAWETAVRVLALGRGMSPEPAWDALVDGARSLVARTVAGLVTADPDGIGDWVAAGEYTGDESPEQLAREYDRATADV